MLPLAEPIAAATADSSSASTEESTVSAISASPPASRRATCMAAMLTPASPRIEPIAPTTPGRSE